MDPGFPFNSELIRRLFRLWRRLRDVPPDVGLTPYVPVISSFIVVILGFLYVLDRMRRIIQATNMGIEYFQNADNNSPYLSEIRATPQLGEGDTVNQRSLIKRENGRRQFALLPIDFPPGPSGERNLLPHTLTSADVSDHQNEHAIVPERDSISGRDVEMQEGSSTMRPHDMKKGKVLLKKSKSTTSGSTTTPQVGERSLTKRENDKCARRRLALEGQTPVDFPPASLGERDLLPSTSEKSGDISGNQNKHAIVTKRDPVGGEDVKMQEGSSSMKSQNKKGKVVLKKSKLTTPGSTTTPQVEVLDTYSTPRDSKQHLNPEEDQKYLTSPDKEYSQPYTTESSGPTSDDDFFLCDVLGNGNQKILDLNSPDSINEDIIKSLSVLSPTKTDTTAKRHPSPYYYGDLYKYRTTENPSSAIIPNNPRQNQSLRPEVKKESKYPNTNRKSRSNRKFRKSASSDNPNEAREKPKTRPKASVKHKSSSIETQSTDSRDAPNGNSMPPNPLTVTAYDDYGLDDMTRQRHVYETAFDCRISKSDDDLDQIDKVTNHSVLIHVNKDWENQPRADPSISGSTLNRKIRGRDRETCSKSSQEDNNSVLALSHEIKNLHLAEAEENHSASSSGLPLRGYTPSPPSTAPLPAKFHGKEHTMNSIRSAPNLPSHPKSRHLPIKSLTTSSDSLQIRQGSAFEIEFGCSSNKLISEFKGRPLHPKETDKDRIYEFKNRPRKEILLINKRSKDSLLDFKGRRIRHKYSSTESMTTSSSGGSMESIKSSTSEGNRSTSSSESRQSPSLSSHSSDSGGNPKKYTVPQGSGGFLGNKLHILSPISDKSSQEPMSETSDNNRNNNSQKCSPEEVQPTTAENLKTKRRLPQNKNLLNLGFHTTNPEIQGSDSGISIQSREGIKSRFSLTGPELSAPPSHLDFSDLPFDMPKLRRRRAVPETACTSGSATSVDLRDLPFDMPKLRRRMRLQPSNLEASASQASSSQSVIEADRQALCRPKLTLNLSESGNRQKHRLGMTLSGLGLTLNSNVNQPSTSSDTIDVCLPLEKQGWFHGQISRVEAENVLRVLKEGSFLVRNSESIKNDFSLSLKSARGFMHMRIQKNSEDGSFVLGQFSKPFKSIPEMIKHFSINRLPIRGAEHMCLLQPVIAQLL